MARSLTERYSFRTGLDRLGCGRTYTTEFQPVRAAARETLSTLSQRTTPAGGTHCHGCGCPRMLSTSILDGNLLKERRWSALRQLAPALAKCQGSCEDGKSVFLFRTNCLSGMGRESQVMY